MTQRIAIDFAGVPQSLTPLIRRAIRKTVLSESGPWLKAQGSKPLRVSLSVAFTADPEIALLNERFLSHKGPTDVLTFPLSAPSDLTLEGQIIVSTDTARREAAARNHPWQSEALLYVIHGLLHLLGHDDHKARDRAIMHAREDAILTALGLGPVYHSRHEKTHAPRRHPAPRQTKPAQRKSARRAPRSRIRRRP